MDKAKAVITGIGIVAPGAVGKDEFWKSLEEGKDSISDVSSFDVSEFPVKIAGEVKDFDAKKILGPKGLRNLDKNALFLMSASKMALDGSGLAINETNTDDFGVCTGTTFSHLWSIAEFDKEVFVEGLNFSNPALFPSTVVNAASSHVSIRFNIQGFNTTITTGYTSYLESLKYTLNALDTDKAKHVLSAGVDTLTGSLFFGFNKLGYMAGLKGVALSCPFDKRRNGPVPAEGAGVFCVEKPETAKVRGAKIYAGIRAVACYFDSTGMGKINPYGEGLEKSIRTALDQAGLEPSQIDCVWASANSSLNLDRIEAGVLKRIFGAKLSNIPVVAIKSMIGESFSAAGALQIASCIGTMNSGIIPPTINYNSPDPDCKIDSVSPKAQKKDVKFALINSFGPGGYNSACIIEKYGVN